MPNAVIADSNGNLYGTTQLGPDGPGGRQSTAAIFYKLTWTGSSYSQSVLHTFCSQPNCADGQQPLGPLTLDSSGAILGTTEFGGLNNQGTIFQYPRSFFVVYSFCASGSCTDGSNPMGGVIIAADGSLYGTTNVGGDNGRGVVFKLGTGYQVLYSFCPLTPQHACLNNGGANPQAGVLVDGSGDIFGTTANGGQYGSPTFGGELFELTP
jgi:uncharacterized repeat protein (TIGR03803 family)